MYSARNSMNCINLALILIFLNLCAEEYQIGFEERFALAQDREALLKSLLQGSEPYYFYASLFYQQSGQLDKAAALLNEWQLKNEKSERMQTLQARQILLNYERDPQDTLSRLIDKFNIQHGHQPSSKTAETIYPSALEPGQIAIDAFVEKARMKMPPMSGFHASGLYYALTNLSLTELERRAALQQLQTPDLEHLPELVATYLRSTNNSFESLSINKKLTLTQLEKLSILNPELFNEHALVEAMLLKLRPSDHSNWEFEAHKKRAYLERIWNYVNSLNETFDPLKYHISYHRFIQQYDAAHDIRKAALLDLLRFRKWQDTGHGLMRKWSEVLGLPERPKRCLIHDLLLEILGKENDYEDLKPYYRESELQSFFAEAKLLAGIEPLDRWLAQLGNNEEVQTFKNRVDLSFTPANKIYYTALEQPELSVTTKNIRHLRIVIYRLNTLNYLLQESVGDLKTLDLDGSTPLYEETIEIDRPEFLKVRHSFKPESMKGPGIYIVDLLGNGKRCRAIIEKGTLRYTSQVTAKGFLFKIYDETHNLQKTARIWANRRLYPADLEGQILVPFTRPGEQINTIVLQTDERCTKLPFNAVYPKYELITGIYTDRAALLPGHLAEFVVQPQLIIDQQTLDCSVLYDTSIEITETDLWGNTNTHLRPVTLETNKDLIVPYSIMEGVRQLKLTLHAKVKGPVTGEEINLDTSRQFELNGIDQGSDIEQILLMQDKNGYRIRLVGKNGEPQPKRPGSLIFSHEYFTVKIEHNLQTDERGEVKLGPLFPHIGIEVYFGQTRATFFIGKDWSCIYPKMLTVYEQEPIRLPWYGLSIDRFSHALLEFANGQNIADRFGKIRGGKGSLEIEGLAAGEYILTCKASKQKVQITVFPGKRMQHDQFLFSGGNINSESKIPPILNSIKIEQGVLIGTIENATPGLNIHALGEVFPVNYSIYNRLQKMYRFNKMFKLQSKPTLTAFCETTDIDSEYEYILSRRQERIFLEICCPGLACCLIPGQCPCTDNSQCSV